jgi:large subunit ribosomal protein L4
MIQSAVYNQEGKKSGTIDLPESVFGLPWNADLVHQVVLTMQTAARNAIAHTKNRGEVRGGGKKPWQQKGTGRARHGSRRSPIWVGGGVAHGPRNEKNFDRKINRKMKAKALFTILSRKFKEGEVLFLNEFAMSAPKTKEALAILGTVSTIDGFKMILKKRNNSAYIALGSKNPNVEKSFRNFGNIIVDEARNLLNAKHIVITNPEETVAFLSGKMAKAEGAVETKKSMKARAPKEAKAAKAPKVKAEKKPRVKKVKVAKAAEAKPVKEKKAAKPANKAPKTK